MPSLQETLPSTGFTYNGLNPPLPGGSGSSLDVSSGGSGSSIDWTKLLGGGAAAGLASMFGSANDSILPPIGKINNSADTLSKEGAQSFLTGEQAISPALKYFETLLSGDPLAVLAATAPERARVIDQYSSARRAIGTAMPRGGGQASAVSDNLTRQATDLSTTTSSLRSNAATALGALGGQAEARGLSAQEASVQAMASTLAPLFAKSQQDNQDVASLFSGIGALVGAAIFL